MLNGNLICMILALVCFLLAFFNRPSNLAVSIGWLGMFFYVLGQILR